jgi:hypothetical protein
MYVCRVLARGNERTRDNGRKGDAMPRISANLSKEVVSAIEELARRNNISKTEVIRRAVAMEKFLEDQKARGADVLVRQRGSAELERVVRP